MLQNFKYKIHDILEMGVYGNRLGAAFDWFMIGLILANVAAVALETVPEFNAQYGYYLHLFDILSVMIFTVEYLARVWVSTVGHHRSGISALKVRWNYIKSPMAIIDLLAVLPFYLAFLVPVVDLRFLRIVRLLRMLKLVRYSPALVSLLRVIYEERRALFATLLIMLGLTFIAATVGYYFEYKAQPDKFGSIPEALWWALATLTTVGYGDVVPITTMGKILGGVVMIFGLALYAIPIGIVASAFSNEIHRRDFVVRYGLVAKVPLFDGMDAETIAEISKLLRSIVVEDGAVISHKGQLADGLYFIVSGQAVAILNGKDIIISSGGFFGEISLLKDTYRDVTIVAKGTCRLMMLETQDFQHLLVMRPELRKRLYDIVDKRLSENISSGHIKPEDKVELLEKHLQTYGPFSS